MKYFLILVFGWYAQDLLQILMTQTLLAPEIYMAALLWCATRQSEEHSPLPWIAAAVVGGILMDLRWIGVPGLCGALYTASLLGARWFWFQIPGANRRMLPYLFTTTMACLIMTPFRLLFWDTDVISGRITTVVLVHWSLTVVVLLIFALTRPYSDEDDYL